MPPMPRRMLVVLALIGLLASCKTTSPPTVQGPVDLTVARLHNELASGKTSVRHVEEQYASRIAALDSHGPTLRAVLEVNPDASVIAAGLEASHEARGPLYGVPVLLKDNIDTADRMLTTAGSLALVSSKPA